MIKTWVPLSALLLLVLAGCNSSVTIDFLAPEPSEPAPTQPNSTQSDSTQPAPTQPDSAQPSAPAQPPGPVVTPVSTAVPPVVYDKTVHVTACGTLSQPNTLYILDNDVRSDGTCFKITADSVIFDLGGHTVLYDDYPDVGLQNADFENGTGSVPADWDLSQAGGVTRQSTADFAMLNKWYLAFGNAPNGTRITSPWTKLLPLDKAAAFFLRGDATWAYSNAPLWNMTVESRNATGSIEVVLNKDFTTDQKFEFTASATALEYRAVLTLVDGYGLAFSSYGRFPSIDLFDIRAKDHYGVNVSYRKNVTVQNGTITQGRGKGYLSHALHAYADTYFKATDLIINVNGMLSSGINGNYSRQIIIDKCKILARTPGGTFNRAQITATVIATQGDNVAIINSEIDGGPGYGGILVHGAQSEIANNLINTQSMITNHFALMGGSSIHDNTIIASPGQGISAGGDTEVYNNTISILKTAPNYEYGYIGSDAIKFNDYNDPAHLYQNINVHHNKVYLFGDYDKYYTGYDDAIGRGTKLIKGITNHANGGNVRFADNTFIARTIDPSVRLIAIEAGGRTPLEVLFENNTIDSDHICVDFGGYSGQGTIFPALTFIGNTFIKGPGASTSFHTIGLDRTGNINTDTISFIGSKLMGGASLTDVEIPSSYGRFSYGVYWYLNLNVLSAAGLPVAGASVSILDSNFAQVYTGETDSNGTISNIKLKQLHHTGNGVLNQSAIQNTSPLNVTVTPAGGSAAQYTIDMTQNKTLTYRLGSGFSVVND